MANGHGGTRPGSGRKPQSETIRKVDPEIINAGILPLEMRLRVSRHLWAEAIDGEGKIIDLAKAKEAAEFAEPALRYTSPALATVAHTGPQGGPIEVSQIDKINRDLQELMRVAAEETTANTHH